MGRRQPQKRILSQFWGQTPDTRGQRGGSRPSLLLAIDSRLGAPRLGGAQLRSEWKGTGCSTPASQDPPPHAVLVSVTVASAGGVGSSALFEPRPCGGPAPRHSLLPKTLSR